MIGTLRQFVSAARRTPADSRQISLAGMGAGILDRQSGFVGELAEIHLMPVRGLGEHADVRAGAEHVVLARTKDDDFHLGMLEPQPLHRVGEFDIDAEIVGVQLQLVSAQQRRIWIDIHRQSGNRAVEGQFPVPVAAGVGLEIDHAVTSWTKAISDESVGSGASRCGACRAAGMIRVWVGAWARRFNTSSCSWEP